MKELRMMPFSNLLKEGYRGFIAQIEEFNAMSLPDRKSWLAKKISDLKKLEADAKASRDSGIANFCVNEIMRYEEWEKISDNGGDVPVPAGASFFLNS